MERAFPGIAEQSRPKVSANSENTLIPSLASTALARKPRGIEVRNKSCQDAKSGERGARAYYEQYGLGRPLCSDA